MLTFNWICCVTVSLFMGIPFLMDPMVLATLYVWCQLNKDVIVNFWFGTQFKVRHKGNQTGYCLVVHEKSKFLLTPLIFAFQAMYLPWVLFAFNMIIADTVISVKLGPGRAFMTYHLLISKVFSHSLRNKSKNLLNFIFPISCTIPGTSLG